MNMDKEQLIDWLKDNLRIVVERHAGCGETEVYIVLYYKDIELSRSRL